MTKSPRLDPMSDAKDNGLSRLFLISIFVVAVDAALMFSPFLSVPLDYLNTSFPLDFGLCLSGIWILLVAFAVGTYGKRGLWLLIGMPIALYLPVILALSELGWIDPVIETDRPVATVTADIRSAVDEMLTRR